MVITINDLYIYKNAGPCVMRKVHLHFFDFWLIQTPYQISGIHGIHGTYGIDGIHSTRRQFDELFLIGTICMH